MSLLENRLYTIIDSEQSELNADASTFTIRLLPESDIFAAHFPSEPVLPGACSLQIVLELAERWLGCPIALLRITNLKFLAVVRPTDVPELKVTLEQHPDGFLRAQLADDTTLYSKFSLAVEK